MVDLKCHTSTPIETVRSIAVLVRRAPSADLELTFRLDGDTSGICVPSSAAPHFATDLWRHTCFEAFIAADEQTSYHEFNFSPSGDWAIYAFSGYRKGAPVSDESMRPQIALRSSDCQLEVEAYVRLSALAAIQARTVLRVGLSAVVETREGLSYWALHHPAEKPDFHNANGFTLRLKPPDLES